METTTYNLKISPQGQLTLPRRLREQLQVRPGSRIAVRASSEGHLQISNNTSMKKHFGTLPHLWTTDAQDAAAYSRQLRDSMQPKL